jgi:hypothetical protein
MCSITPHWPGLRLRFPKILDLPLRNVPGGTIRGAGAVVVPRRARPRTNLPWTGKRGTWTCIALVLLFITAGRRQPDKKGAVGSGMVASVASGSNHLPRSGTMQHATGRGCLSPLRGDPEPVRGNREPTRPRIGCTTVRHEHVSVTADMCILESPWAQHSAWTHRAVWRERPRTEGTSAARKACVCRAGGRGYLCHQRDNIMVRSGVGCWRLTCGGKPCRRRRPESRLA